MDEEHPTNAGLAQENGFGSAYLRRWPWLVKGSAVLCTCKKECNKYDLTAAECSDWSIIMIRPGGLLLLVVPHLFAVPVSVLLVGLPKST
jgi:hypothetical protein